MASTKKFFHDGTALLLVSAASFLTLVSIVLILLKLNTARGTVIYIIAYQPRLGVEKNIMGTVTGIWALTIAALAIYGLGMLLAYRAHKIRREVSLTVLFLTLALLAFLIIISYHLLNLRG